MNRKHDIWLQAQLSLNERPRGHFLTATRTICLYYKNHILSHPLIFPLVHSVPPNHHSQPSTPGCVQKFPDPITNTFFAHIYSWVHTNTCHATTHFTLGGHLFYTCPTENSNTFELCFTMSTCPPSVGGCGNYL